MMLQLEMEELVLVSEELEPYVLEIQPGSEIDGVVDCFTLAVMRRADGVLLAMPAEALPQEVVDAGNREDSTGIFGPSTVAIVPGVVQNNVGPTGQDLPVLLIDCGRGVSAFLRQPEIGEEMTFGFDEDRPHALPSPNGLLSAACQWVASASGRPSFYTAESAEEEDVVQEPVAPPLPKRQQRRPGPGEGTPSAKGGAKPKRMTTAALASSMEGLMLAIPKLTDQLQTLAERQQAVEDHLVGAPLPARAQLARPLGETFSTPHKSNLASLAKAMSPAPRTVQQPAMGVLAPLTQKPATVQELEEEKMKEASDQTSLAQAVLAQSQALTTLVSQIAAAGQDPMGGPGKSRSM